MVRSIRIYVINLDRSADRREAMRAQLDTLGQDYEFVSAVDGRAGEHLSFPNYREEFCLRVWRRPLMAGEVGTFASHYLLWQRCVGKDEPMIIMEDDVEICRHFAEAMQLLPALGSMGYVRLAGISARPFRTIPRALPGDWRLVRFLTGPLGAQCYALFPRGATRLLAGTAEWTLPVDNYMDCFWEHGVSCLGLMPFPISIPRSGGSTIWSVGPSPSALMRDRVRQPKRFLARKVGDFRRHWANFEYAVGLREPIIDP